MIDKINKELVAQKKHNEHTESEFNALKHNL
jgi:hypothetical protein